MVDEASGCFSLVQDRERTQEMMEERAAEDASSNDAFFRGNPEGATQGPPAAGPPGADSEATTCMQDNCEKVPQEQSQSPDAEEQGGGGPPGRAQALFDCGAVGSR